VAPAVAAQQQQQAVKEQVLEGHQQGGQQQQQQQREGRLGVKQEQQQQQQQQERMAAVVGTQQQGKRRWYQLIAVSGLLGWALLQYPLQHLQALLEKQCVTACMKIMLYTHPKMMITAYLLHLISTLRVAHCCHSRGFLRRVLYCFPTSPTVFWLPCTSRGVE
jgi:hypothetical protein